jgi:transcriptional regulator with XRE-family HTH domain
MGVFMSKKQMREKMKDSIAVRVNEKEVKTLAQLTLEFKLLQSELNKAMDKDDPSLISLKENLRKVQRQKELAEQWEIEEIRQIRVLEAFREKCIEADFMGLYRTGTRCGNMVGDRIRRIMHNMGLTIIDLEAATGVSRSSLQRFLRDSTDTRKTDIPKVATLKKILSNELFVFNVDLFTRYPDNYKKWEEAYDGGLPVEMDGVKKPFTNYDQIKGYLIDQLRNPLSYLITEELPTQSIKGDETDGTNKHEPQHKIAEVPMPDEIAQIFATHLLNVFETIDLLLKPEKKKTPSVVISYKSLDETISYVEEDKTPAPIVVEEFPG